MNYHEKIIEAIELHSVEGIRECFENGVSPNDHFRDEPLIYELTSEYTRTPRFKDCVKLFIDYGLQMDDEALLSVLCDDAAALDLQLNNDPGALQKKYSLRSAYTPLYAATLLHICAEFDHVACARVLVKHGAGIDEVAGLDEHGFGGQTPIFHTVNQNANNSIGMLHYLLDQQAGLQLTVTGLVWGRGYEWETLIPAVNPVSYAMMGLLPQMHRDETTISGIVQLLIKKAYGVDYALKNVPCKYLG